jgi:hypothetical protein
MLVKGNIRSIDSCNLWVNSGPLNLGYESGSDSKKLLKNGKLTKKQAGYLCSIPQKLRQELGKG